MSVLISGAIAYMLASGSSPVELRCVATNGFVRSVVFDEDTGIIRSDGKQVTGRVLRDAVDFVIIYRVDRRYAVNIDRASGKMTWWDLDTREHVSDYQCDIARKRKF